MADRLKVLIVDDDKTWQAFLMVALQDIYDVRLAGSGDEGEQIASEWLPDTILLDIEMPGRKGYDVCKSLKSTPKVKNIPVIFLSGSSSLQEKIVGFELGADDYLVKPCDAQYLQAKVKRSCMLYREKLELDKLASTAQALAFEAMNSSADLGRCLRFAERTYAMNNFEKLADGLFQTMAEFGLDTSVMFISNDGPRFFSANKHELSPLEQDMFLAVHHEGRLCDFGRRTFCNFTLVSLLIKNMPVDNPERYGHIKDTVPLILGAADGKVGALNLHNTLIMQHQQVSQAIDSLRNQLLDIAQGFNVGTDILAVETDSLFALLNDNSQASASYRKIRDQLAQYNQLGGQLTDVLKALQYLAEDQDKIHQTIIKSPLGDVAELGADEIFSSGVDFF